MKLLLLLAAWAGFVWFVMWLGTPVTGTLYTHHGKKLMVPNCARCDSIHAAKQRLGVTFK